MKKPDTSWLLMLAGIILLFLGGFAIVSPLNAYIKMVQYSGLLLAINGFLLVVVSYTCGSSLKEKEWIMTEGLLDLIFSAVLVFNILLSFVTFPYFIGAWMIGKGILKMSASLTLIQFIRGWQFVFSGGLLFVFFGLLVIRNPVIKAYGITLFIGSFGLVVGALYIFDAFRFRRIADTLNMII